MKCMLMVLSLKSKTTLKSEMKNKKKQTFILKTYFKMKQNLNSVLILNSM